MLKAQVTREALPNVCFKLDATPVGGGPVGEGGDLIVVGDHRRVGVGLHPVLREPASPGHTQALNIPKSQNVTSSNGPC